MKRTLTREFYIPTGYKLDGPANDKYAVYTGISPRHNLPSALFFTGKQSKPTWFFSFHTVEDMYKRINETVELIKARDGRKAERAEARKAPHSLKVGDTLYTSWGYEQTNINFYRVVGVMGKQTVKLRELGSKIVSGAGGPTTYVVADESRWLNDKILVKRVSGDNYVKIASYATAWLWDGKPKYETGSGWGH